MTISQNHRISRWTAEFADQATEGDFRRAIQAVWTRSTRIALAIVATIFLIFAWSDYLRMGLSGPYAFVFFARFGVFLLGVLGFLFAGRYAKWVVNGAIPTVLVLAAHLVFVLIIPYRDISVGAIGMSMMTMLMGVYVFVPNRFMFSIGVGILATTGFIWEVMVTYDLGFANVIHFVMLMAFINLLGGIGVYRVNWQMREQYLTTVVLRESNAQLSSEIAARQRLEAELREMALRDDLTGLANRRQFFDQAERELQLARRQGQSASLLLLDIDHFREINGRYGHVRSDEVLRTLAVASRAWLQEGEWLARAGGEEFAVLLTGVGQSTAQERAEQLRQLLEQTPVNLVDATLYFTVSIGVAEVQANESLGMLMRRADVALQAAKAAGRNRVSCADASIAA